MSNIVFDTSAVLAILKGERIAMGQLPNIRWATMSAVNAAEVWTRLADLDETAQDAGSLLMKLLRNVEPFTETQARRTGELRQLGKNVSLGDRACLALAMELSADVYTADRAWAGFNVGCRIHLIR